MKAYVGEVHGPLYEVRVHEDGREPRLLDPRIDVARLSPAGRFAWGFNSCDCSQLALALCLDALDGDAARAQSIYLVFKHGALIRDLHPKTGWTLSQDDVLRKIDAIERGIASEPRKRPEPTDCEPEASPF